MKEQMKTIRAARDYIQTKTSLVPQIAIVLGSGLGGLADKVQADAIIPFTEIPGFAQSTVSGHAGKLIVGTMAGKSVIMMQGRLHYYEGLPMSAIIFPIRVMRLLGAKLFIVTNAAGGLNPDFTPGDIMLITDHINVQGNNALIGANLDEVGPRFPDMTHTYTPELQQLALEIAAEERIELQQGVYAAWSGPTFETPAERRYLRIIGGDAVGMSTVPEVTAANHAGMDILGFSVITNVATGGPEQPPDDHLEVLAMANAAGEKLVRLVERILEKLPDQA
jgi:purine-nucleoside phosphorylase